MFECLCKNGFNGTLCEHDINPCRSSPCKNDGTCVNGIDDFDCECRPGFDGDLCENDIDECASSPCHPSSTCVDAIDGYECKCARGYNGTHCDQDVDWCASGPCQHGGECTNQRTRHECDCAEGYVGRNCETFVENPPEIISIHPDKGPASGGTFLTVIGKHFIPNITLFLDYEEYQADAFKSNSTLAVASSPALDLQYDSGLIGKPLEVSVLFASGQLQDNTEFTFTYMEDPIIESVDPLETIVGGGTTLTVNGDSLEIVHNITMEITLIHTEHVSGGRDELHITHFTSPCVIISDESFECVTPEMGVPDKFLPPPTKKTKRSVPHFRPALRGERRRRDAPLERADDDSLRFELGFYLDGVSTWRNMSRALPEYGRLDVYARPPRFNATDHTYVFEEKELLFIKGERLLEGMTKADYAVRVGGTGRCRVRDVTNTQLACLPPQAFGRQRRSAEEEEESEEGSEEASEEEGNRDRDLDIVVSIGTNIEAKVGVLHYPHPQLLSTAHMAGIIVGGVVLIILVIAVSVWLCRRKGEDEDERWDKMIHAAAERMQPAREGEDVARLAEVGMVSAQFGGSSNHIRRHRSGERRRHIDSIGMDPVKGKKKDKKRWLGKSKKNPKHGYYSSEDGQFDIRGKVTELHSHHTGSLSSQTKVDSLDPPPSWYRNMPPSRNSLGLWDVDMQSEA